MRRELAVQVALDGSPTAASADLTWTDVAVGAQVLVADGVNAQRGCTSASGSASAGSCSFTIRNDRGRFTGASLLRRPVRLVAIESGARYTLGRWHITDADEYREGIRRLKINCSDVLALAAEATVGGNVDWFADRAGVVARWPLTDSAAPAMPARGTAEGSMIDLPGPGASTYGDVLWSQSSSSPTGGTSIRCQPADPFALPSLGTTAVQFPLPGGAIGGMNVWCRVPPDALIDAAPTVWVGALMSLRARAPWRAGLGLLPTELNISVSIPSAMQSGSPMVRPAGNVLLGIGAGGALSVGTWDVGFEWFNVEILWGVPGWVATVRRSDGTVAGTLAEGFSPTFYTSGFDAATLGASTFPSLPVCPAEFAELNVWTSGAGSELFNAAVGWPGELAQARLNRVAAQAGWPANRLTLGEVFPFPLAGGDQSQRTLASHVTDVEDSTLGLSGVDRDGNVVVITRNQWETAAPVAYLPASVLSKDADGITTNTGFLANTATVTRADGTTATATDTYSRDTWGALSDDRSISVTSQEYATKAAGWLAHNRSDPAKAYGLPQLTMLLESLESTPYRAVPYAVDCGQVVQINDMADAPIRARVTGISWQIDRSGWRCTWHARPDSTPDWFQLDRDSLDGRAILGW